MQVLRRSWYTTAAVATLALFVAFQLYAITRPAKPALRVLPPMPKAGAVRVLEPVKPVDVAMYKLPPADATILVVVTACNLYRLTREVLTNLLSLPDPIQVIVFDDHSEDNTAARVASEFPRVRVWSADRAVGLTYAWNTGYRIFKHNPQFQHLFISNNDILYPPTAFTRMAEVLDTVGGMALVGPMTNRAGLGGWALKSCPYANAETVFPQLADAIVDQAVMHDDYRALDVAVQTAAAARGLHYNRSRVLLGFVQGMGRAVLAGEHSPGNLWDPANMVIGQEREMRGRKKFKFFVAQRVLVYHGKGQTVSGGAERQDVTMCHQPDRVGGWA